MARKESTDNTNQYLYLKESRSLLPVKIISIMFSDSPEYIKESRKIHVDKASKIDEIKKFKNRLVEKGRIKKKETRPRIFPRMTA